MADISDAALTAREASFASAVSAARTPSGFLAAWFGATLLPAEEQAVFDAYYIRFRRAFGPRLRHWYDRQLDEVGAALAARPGARLLEIGMGTGTESLWFALQGARVMGVEPYTPYARVAEARHALLSRTLGRALALEIRRCSVLDLDEPEGFDIVWMEQTFHHLEPRARMVGKIASLLRPGGTLVIAEANGLNPLLQAQLFRQRGFRTIGTIPGPDGAPMPFGFERVLSARRLARHMREAGLTDVRAAHFRLLPSHPAFDALFPLERRLGGIAPPFAFTHYNLVARKPEAAGRDA